MSWLEAAKVFFKDDTIWALALFSSTENGAPSAIPPTWREWFVLRIQPALCLLLCFFSPYVVTILLALFPLPLCLFLVTPFHWWRSGCWKLTIDLCCLWHRKGPHGTILIFRSAEKLLLGSSALIRAQYLWKPSSFQMFPSMGPKSKSLKFRLSSFGWIPLPFSSNKHTFSFLFSCFPHGCYLSFCFSLLWCLPTFCSPYDHSTLSYACYATFPLLLLAMLNTDVLRQFLCFREASREISAALLQPFLWQKNQLLCIKMYRKHI